MKSPNAYHLSVFPYSLDEEDGGNPTTIFLNADEMSSEQMQSLAKESGHECGFVLSGATGDNARTDLGMRYWVPNHEMEMCGHATVGAIWVMDQLGLLPPTERISISTISGLVEARVDREELDTRVLVSQPKGSVEDIANAHVFEIVSCLGITADDLAPGLKVQNARTSRTKTLIPLKSRDILDKSKLDSCSVREICEKINSTGLYPYVVIDAEDQIIEARQYPKSAGYPEDPATGIAAAALSFGLLETGLLPSGTTKPLFVRQGWRMGKPSEIQVQFRLHEGSDVTGCWISGKVRRAFDGHQDTA
jgi:PhzF family phenazine biosynthesis protein